MNKRKKHDDCKEATFEISCSMHCCQYTKLAHIGVYSRVCITTTNKNHVVVIRYGISYCIIASNRSTYTLYYAHSDFYKYYRVVFPCYKLFVWMDFYECMRKSSLKIGVDWYVSRKHHSLGFCIAQALCVYYYLTWINVCVNGYDQMIKVYNCHADNIFVGRGMCNVKWVCLYKTPDIVGTSGWAYNNVE